MKDIDDVLAELGCEDSIYLTDIDNKPMFVEAIIGKNNDNRLVYDYELMVEWMLNNKSDLSVSEAIETIDKNTIGLIERMENAPIIFYKLRG